MSDYTAWLIETDFGDGPVYHQFQMDDDWTKDQDAACHFARKQDAEQVIAYYGWTIAKAVEHMWPVTKVSNFEDALEEYEYRKRERIARESEY